MVPLPIFQLYAAPYNLRVICHHEVVVSLEAVHLCKRLLRYGGRCGRTIADSVSTAGTRRIYDGMKLLGISRNQERSIV